jgi:Co/Zn/Cd efflux system component
MSSACCHADQVSEHRRVLWTVLTINLIMFLIEVGAGLAAGSAGWPDIIVATTMAALALQGAWIVVGQSRAELRISASHDIVMGAK